MCYLYSTNCLGSYLQVLLAEQRSIEQPCSLKILSNTQTLSNKVKRILPASFLSNTTYEPLCAPSELSSLSDVDVVLLAIDSIDTDHLPILSAWGNSSLSVIVVTLHLRDTERDLLAQCGICDAITLQDGLEQLLFRSIQQLSTSRNAHLSPQRDMLTGFANRAGFYQRASDLLLHSQLNAAIISLELDGFKKMSIQKGHNYSDRVLQQLSFRLRRTLPPGYLCARFERDEFAILILDSNKKSIASRASSIAQQLCRALSSPYMSSERSTMLPCSMGVAVNCCEQPSDLDELIRQASTARLLAKSRRNCSYKIYEATVEETHSIEQELEPELSTALRGGEFSLYFQPQINLQSGMITGAEALIRWQHAKRGLVMPNDFIPMSERNGMIIPMGYWAIHEAIGLLNRLHKAGHPNSEVAVNVSFRQFQDSNLTKIIRRILAQNPILSGHLKFELTETALVNDELYVSDCIQELSSLGIEFALDDFGTGYSSFSLLQNLPINTVKIDRSFVRHIPDNQRDCNIVSAMISLAHNLGKTVVAEGVETEEQLDFMKSVKCDVVQGYYFSPPVHFDTYLELLS